MRDVGDHFGDDMEEDGDCVPTCVFRVLDMDIAKDFSVEVAVVKMTNCHFETSLGCKVYCFQQKTLDSHLSADRIC